MTRFYPLQKLAVGDIRRNFKDVKALHRLCQRRQQRPDPGVPVSGDLAPGQMFRPGNGAIIPALDNPPGRIGPGMSKLRLGVRFSVQRLVLPQHNITQPGRERRQKLPGVGNVAPVDPEAVCSGIAFYQSPFFFTDGAGMDGVLQQDAQALARSLGSVCRGPRQKFNRAVGEARVRRVTKLSGAGDRFPCAEADSEHGATQRAQAGEPFAEIHVKARRIGADQGLSHGLSILVSIGSSA